MTENRDNPSSSLTLCYSFLQALAPYEKKRKREREKKKRREKDTQTDANKSKRRVLMDR